MLQPSKFCALAAVMLAAAAPAIAQFTPVSTPGASYTSSTTLIAITQGNGTPAPSISGGGQTVTFSTSLTAGAVGSGWSTWGAPPNTESTTPRIVYTFTSLSSLTMTLSSPASAFGFEIEPNSFGVHPFTATFMNGSTTLGSVTRNVEGNAGALLAAAMSTPSITSVVLTIPSSAAGFALAQFRFSFPAVTAIPSVSTTGICGLGMALLAGGALLARKQQMAS